MVFFHRNLRTHLQNERHKSHCVYRHTQYSFFNFVCNLLYNILLTVCLKQTSIFSVYRNPVSSYTVRSGSTFSNSGGTIHNVSRIVIHPNYNRITLDFDVALLQVCISFNVSIYNVICITYCCDNQLYLTLLLCKMHFF